jgi:hypothetical protein
MSIDRMTSQRTVCQVIDYGGRTAGSFIPALAALARAVVARGDRFVVTATRVPGAQWSPELERFSTRCAHYNRTSFIRTFRALTFRLYGARRMLA